MHVRNFRGAQARRRDLVYEITIDPDHYRIKEELPGLADTWDPGDAVSELLDVLLDMINPFYQPRIDAIKKRKKLSDSAVTTDRDVARIIAEREAEMRQLEEGVFRLLLRRGPGGTFMKREFLADVKGALSELRGHGADLTQKNLARVLGYSARNIRGRLKNYDMTWDDLLREAEGDRSS